MNNKNKLLVVSVVITSIIVMTITFSKYKSKSKIVDSASVARPVMSLSNDVLNISINPQDNEKSYIFEVSNYDSKNKLEVTMQYRIEVNTSNNLPLNFELYKYDENTKDKVGENLLITNTTENEIMSYEQKTTNKYILKIKWDENEKNYLYSKEIDYIELTLNSKQID